jgi:UDP-N-acetylglucosamine 2-epimerase
MKKQKIMLIFGTRPEAIKMAPIINEFRKYSKLVKVIVVVSAQHREMLDQILQLFKISVDYDLDIMKRDQTLFDITSGSLVKLKQVLKKEKPDMVLVQGDTTTSFAASLSANFLKIPVGHVEAGLRTYNKYSPFPEEMNRQLISLLSDIHFAPSRIAFNNLLQENISKEKIYLTGNTVIDALLETERRNCSFEYIGDVFIAKKLLSINFDKKVVLVTAHRRESFGKPIENICLAIAELIKKNKDLEIVFPVHLNPSVQNTVGKILKKKIHLIPPLNYDIFINLMKKSYIILTDSGGIQEEAPALGKPVLVVRNNTERPEAVAAGTVKLIGTNKDLIVATVEKLLNNKKEYKRMAEAVNPYGDGKAAERIVRCLLRLPFKEFQVDLAESKKLNG